MPFCTKCGRQLNDGEQCGCTAQQSQQANQQSYQQQPNGQQFFSDETKAHMKRAAGEFSEGMKATATATASSAKESFDSFRRTIRSKSAYERGQQIIPDTIKANESEIPIRQYDHIAKLRSRCKLTWAEGKMQLTNKRLIFRAPGRCLISGNTVLQHEFAIDDIAGIELRRDHRFSFLDFLIGYLISFVGCLPMAAFSALGIESPAISVILALLASVALLVPFFKIGSEKRRLKLFVFACLASSFLSIFMTLGIRHEFFTGLGIIVAIPLAIVLIYLYLRVIFQPNLNITVKTNSGTGAIEIRRKHKPFGLGVLFGFGSGQIVEYTGYDEVLPDVDTDRAVRELGAIINDIQKLGDFAVEKWRV